MLRRRSLRHAVAPDGRERVPIGKADRTCQRDRLVEVSHGEGEGAGLHAITQVGPREAQPTGRRTEDETGRHTGCALHTLKAEQPRSGQADAGHLVAEVDLDDIGAGPIAGIGDGDANDDLIACRGGFDGQVASLPRGVRQPVPEREEW